MKKSFTIIMLALIASYATAQSAQRSEDLKSIPGTWWFMAKLDNPVDTLLLIKSGATPPTNVKILTKDEFGMFLFYTPLTEPCDYLIFTPPKYNSGTVLLLHCKQMSGTCPKTAG